MTEPDKAEAAKRKLKIDIADQMAYAKHRCFSCFGHYLDLPPAQSRVIEQTAAFLRGRKPR